MIIFEDGSFMQNPEYPDTLFEPLGKYVIPDDSELCFLYKQYYLEGKKPSLVFDENNNIININYDLQTEIKREKMAQIGLLKKELSDGDYKIIKCYEAQLKNIEPPYDIDTLIAERDAIREQINILQGEVNTNEQ